MDRRARQATVHGVTESDTTEQLNTRTHSQYHYDAIRQSSPKTTCTCVFTAHTHRVSGVQEGQWFTLNARSVANIPNPGIKPASPVSCIGRQILYHWWSGGLVTKSCPTRATPWTAARQAPLSKGFSRQGYWSGLPFSSPGDLPDPGIKMRNRTQVSCIAGRFFTDWPTREAHWATPNHAIPISGILTF